MLSSLPGSKLASLIGDACAREAFERTAQALARLHAYHDHEAPHRTVANHLAGARAGLRSLVQYMPELQREIEEINRLLQGMLPQDQECPPGFVHGDLGLNVLVDSRRIGFIDFDRAHIGPIAADIGSLLSRLCHVRLEGDLADGEADALKDAFLAAYFKAARHSWAPGVIRWWTALPLIQNALRPIRRLDANGPDKVKKLLEEVLRVLKHK
jgi:Ser/Thr protein kinase RdoA (MazF antagonist)